MPTQFIIDVLSLHALPPHHRRATFISCIECQIHSRLQGEGRIRENLPCILCLTEIQINCMLTISTLWKEKFISCDMLSQLSFPWSFSSKTKSLFEWLMLFACLVVLMYTWTLQRDCEDDMNRDGLCSHIARRCCPSEKKAPASNTKLYSRSLQHHFLLVWSVCFCLGSDCTGLNLSTHKESGYEQVHVCLNGFLLLWFHCSSYLCVFFFLWPNTLVHL